MKNLVKGLVLVTMVYGTIVFIANYFTSKKLGTQDGKVHSQIKAFLTAQEGSDSYDAPENDVVTQDSGNVEIKLTENGGSKDPEKVSKKKSKTKRKPARKVKVIWKNNPFALLGAYPDPDLYAEGPDYSQPHYGFINDDGYCNRVDLYNLEHPDNMFKKMNFYTDFFKGAVMKKEVMSKIGTLFMENVHRNMPKNVSESRSYPIDKEVTTFHVSGYNFYKHHKIGTHFLCATQMFSHIPNHTGLIQKDYFPQRLQQYALQYKGRPQCFDKGSLYPATYRLFDKKECKQFFSILNARWYRQTLKKEPIQYLLKIGHDAHKAQGVFLIDKNQTKTLNQDFNRGKNCGKVENYLIVQRYITNPMLLDNNNKFHLRVYMLIASTNPLIVYYHDGYLRASIFPFDKSSGERATHLTNLLMGDQVAEALLQSNSNVTANKTAKELEDYYLWSFEELAKYLLESGKTSDPDWLDNHLRPALQKAFVHVIRMNSDAFWKQSNVYELLGCDFVMDDKMKVWFLEANANPLLDGVQPEMITQMLKDLFEIEYAYYRSRMKRILTVIKMMEKMSRNKPIKKLNEWKKLYQEAARNRLDPEFMIKKNNTWEMIINEALPGAQAYFGIIPEECLKK